MASSVFFLISDEDDEISQGQGHQNTLILCVGELTVIMWASHLLCGRVCCNPANRVSFDLTRQIGKRICLERSKETLLAG